MTYLQRFNTFVQNKLSTRVNDRINKVEEILNSMALDYTRLDFSKIFNGQAARRAIVDRLVSTLRFDLCIETGTFLGFTTSYFARNFPHVYSIEVNPLYCNVARKNLQVFENVELINGDSVAALKTLVPQIGDRRCFVYLDAHWEDHLPLIEELELLATVGHTLIVVDDFQNRGDAGYRYDNYGKGKALDYATFSPVFHKLNYSVFEPNIAASLETGYKRGYVICTTNAQFADMLDRLTDLTRVH